MCNKIGAATAHSASRASHAAARDLVPLACAVLAPELFQKQVERFRHQLSFRLYLRERCRRHAESCGYRPCGPRFTDLDAAFDALTRQRIGELARTAAADPDAGELLVGWKLACAEFAE